MITSRKELRITRPAAEHSREEKLLSARIWERTALTPILNTCMVIE
jgi:hypothetical protein